MDYQDIQILCFHIVFQRSFDLISCHSFIFIWNNDEDLNSKNNVGFILEFLIPASVLFEI